HQNTDKGRFHSVARLFVCFPPKWPRAGFAPRSKSAYGTKGVLIQINLVRPCTPATAAARGKEKVSARHRCGWLSARNPVPRAQPLFERALHVRMTSFA